MSRSVDDGSRLVRELLARHLPGRAVGTVRPLGAGLDNTAYDVDGDLVVRLNGLPDPGERSLQVLREARLLDLVAGWSPLPVPAPVVVAPEEGCLVYARLPGRPLLALPAPDRMVGATGLGTALGELLAALRAIPPGQATEVVAVDDTPPAEWLAEARGLAAGLDSTIPAPHRAAVRSFLDAEPPGPADHLVLSHNDLGIEHVLVDDAGRITGILDWTDAAITDPCRDLGLVLRDLGPAALDAALAGYGPADADPTSFRQRIVFFARCSLLEDLAFGIDGGGDAYVEKSLIGLDWVFGPGSPGSR